MSTEKSMLVPAAIAINAGVSTSPYMQRNMSMTSIEEFVPRLQLPSPTTFNEQYSIRNSKSTANVHDVKKIALDKAVDIIVEECTTPDQGLRGGGIQHEHDMMQQGDLSRFWETDSPSSNNILGVGLVN